MISLQKAMWISKTVSVLALGFPSSLGAAFPTVEVVGLGMFFDRTNRAGSSSAVGQVVRLLTNQDEIDHLEGALKYTEEELARTKAASLQNLAELGAERQQSEQRLAGQVLLQKILAKDQGQATAKLVKEMKLSEFRWEGKSRQWQSTESELRGQLAQREKAFLSLKNAILEAQETSAASFQRLLEVHAKESQPE